MSNLCDRSTRRRRSRAALLRALPVLALLLALHGAGPALAQEIPEADAASVSELKAGIEAAYEVLPTADGLLLRPREEYRGIRTLEIDGTELAVNGETVTREEARGWLGERADLVFRLAELSEAERERLFQEGLPVEDAGGDEDGQAADDEAAAGRVEVLAVPEIPEPPPVPEAPRVPRVRRGSQTVVGSTVRIAADEVAEGVVAFGGSVEVDGRVEGDVTALGGHVDVDGEVTHDVTAIGGDVRLGEDSEVGGDVTSVGGRVDRAPGARVHGKIEEVDEGWGRGWQMPFWGWSWWDAWEGPHWSAWNWIWSLAWPIAEILFLGLLMMLVIALGRPTVERVGLRAGSEPVKAGVVGVLVAILTVPVLIIVSVLLAISIIGIPILIVLLLLFVFVGIPGLLVLALVGYTGVAWRLGRWTEGRFGWRLESPYVAALVGLVFLHGLEVIGQALDFGPLKPFAVMFLVIAALVQLIAGCIGFGAVFLLLYERRARRRAALAPPPPPFAPGPAAPPPPYGPGPAGPGEVPPPAPEGFEGAPPPVEEGAPPPEEPPREG